MKPMEGKLALVTGASRGIGQAIALELARQGAVVAGTATASRGERDHRSAGERGSAGKGYVLNVADESAMQPLVESVQADLGRIHILVNNAGITRDNLLMRMRDDEWDEIMEINLSAVFRLCRLVVRDMIKARDGRIVNVTSVSGEMGNAGQTNYAAAKAGVIGFSKSLAREIGSRNVTVNCVAPGFIDTDMTRALADPQRKPPCSIFRWRASGQPRKSPRRSRFSHRPPPAISRVRPWTSTAAC